MTGDDAIGRGRLRLQARETPAAPPTPHSVGSIRLTDDDASPPPSPPPPPPFPQACDLSSDVDFAAVVRVDGGADPAIVGCRYSIFYASLRTAFCTATLCNLLYARGGEHEHGPRYRVASKPTFV